MPPGASPTPSRHIATARVLALQTPGSAESFYRDASEPASVDTDPSGPVDFGRVREAAERSSGMEVLGPPAFSADPDSKNASTVAEVKVGRA